VRERVEGGEWKQLRVEEGDSSGGTGRGMGGRGRGRDGEGERKIRVGYRKWDGWER